MDKATKKQIQTIFDNLETFNETQIRASFEFMRKKMDVPSIEKLLDRYHETHNVHIEQETEHLLLDLKDKEAIPVIVKMIPKFKASPKLSKLVSVCWQCSLDFSPHIDVFVQSALDGDYQTAIEVYSVIDNVRDNISVPVAKEQMKILERAEKKIIDSFKKSLIREMSELLSQIAS